MTSITYNLCLNKAYLMHILFPLDTSQLPALWNTRQHFRTWRLFFNSKIIFKKAKNVALNKLQKGNLFVVKELKQASSPHSSSARNVFIRATLKLTVP